MALPISIDGIMELHRQAITRWGGRDGVREAGCLDRSLGAAQMAEYYAGNGEGPVGLCFIGSLLFYLCSNSCFIDGNKRTALLAALDILLSYGLTLDAPNDEVRDYCLSIADGKVPSFDHVVRWLSARLVMASETDSFATSLQP